MNTILFGAAGILIATSFLGSAILVAGSSAFTASGFGIFKVGNRLLVQKFNLKTNGIL